jgi:CarD family transcriptional regulator
MHSGDDAVGWSRRYRANLGKLASGNPGQVAEVVGDLELRARDAGLSAGEQRMLVKARQLLSGEAGPEPG